MKGIVLAGGTGSRLHPVTRGHLEAVAARVRQADGVLPAVGADAGGDPRGADHHDPRGLRCVPPPARRRPTVGDRAELRRAGATRGARAGVPDRCRLPRRRRRLAGPRRQPVLRRRVLGHGRSRGVGARGRDRLRLPGARSAAVRHRRARRRRSPRRHRGEASRRAEQLGRDGPLLLRRSRGRGGSSRHPVRTQRTRDHLRHRLLPRHAAN